MAAMESAAHRSDDEEARLRRNTDCIYYLTSPLTCKKGTECEFRHSDAARMNPRDCWYWFNGNCANPKCSFRHPPLDGLLGGPTAPREAQESAPQVAVPAQAHGSIPAGGTATAKQGVPCYYFQKAMCAKGDKCAFLHVPQPTPKVFASALQPNPQLKNSWTKPNSSAQQNTPSGIFDKSKAGSVHDGKPVQKQNLTNRVDQSARNYQNHNSSYVQSGTAKHYHPRSSSKDDLSGNGMEVGEFVTEPSGVLVGDDTKQSSKINHSSYHRTNGERHIGMRQTHGSYESERSHRSSAESLLSEKRISQRDPTPPVSSDLRHRLLKQRKLNDPRSTQVPDRRDERHDHHRRRGEEHDSLSRSRLHGRIKLPGDTSFDRLGLRSEKERDRAPRAIVSSPRHTDLRGKLHERLKARSNEDIPASANISVEKAKNISVEKARSISVEKASSGEDAASLNFAGPKSLAELRAKKKVVSSSGKDAIKRRLEKEDAIKRRFEKEDAIKSAQPARVPITFEAGSNPPSAMLKRKREATSINAAHSGSIHEEEEEEGAVGVEEESHTLEANMEGYGEDEEEGAIGFEEESHALEANMGGYGEEEEGAIGVEEESHTLDNMEGYGEEEEEEEGAIGVEEESHTLEANMEDYGEEEEEEEGAIGLEEEPHTLEGNMEGDGEEEEAFHPEDDVAYDDPVENNAAEDAGKELEEHQDLEAAEDYEYEAADVNAEEDNEYQEYDDDDDLEDDDDFARKVGVMIS